MRCLVRLITSTHANFPLVLPRILVLLLFAKHQATMDTAAAAFPEQLKVFPSRKISTPVSKILRPARRGSALRRDALQRLKRERSGNLGGQQQSPLLLGDADRSSKQGQVLQQSSGEPHIYGGTDNFKKVGAVLGDASAPKGEQLKNFAKCELEDFRL